MFKNQMIARDFEEQQAQRATGARTQGSTMNYADNQSKELRAAIRGGLGTTGYGAAIAPPAEASEFDTEMTRLRHATETSQELVRMLRDRLGLVLHPRPESAGNKTADTATSSQLAGQIRARSDAAECANDVLRDILSALAI